MTKDERVQYKKYKDKVKSQFRETQFDNMSDFEIIEMLIFFCVQNVEAKIIAERLFENFGSFIGILDAKTYDLLSVEGINDQAACLLSLVKPLFSLQMKSVETTKPKLSAPEILYPYLKARFIDTSDERVLALFFDKKDKLADCQVVGQGDFTSSEVDVRKLLSFVLKTDCKNVILAHNHPHGLAEPSVDDIQLTQYLVDVLSNINVKLVDHLILSDTKFYSMRESEMFKDIFEMYEYNQILESIYEEET